MAIYRGTGSASSTSDQATIDEVTTQATNAANSATSAASSASSAASSATSASSSASTATTQASAASTSATSAASSASSASNSATASANSATNAATSATSASSSATAAATARTNAETAQVAAETAQTAAESAVTDAETAQTAAETALASTQAVYDDFDDRYLGAKTSDPTVDNDGDALIDGALYFDTTNAQMKVYDLSGTTWEAFSLTADQLADVDTVATNIADVTSVADNMADVQAAQTSATNAANSATASANSATASANSATAAQTAQTNAETAETNAEAALDEFTDLYLGVKSSAPTLDNDGDALQTGALYYDSTDEQLYIWDGSAWDQAAFSISGSVTSFNTRTGAVTLSSGDVTTALGYTPYNSTNPDSYVTQSAIDTSIASLVDSAPATLDTLNELAAALGDDANFSTTVTNSLAEKAPLASPALTGTPTAPTATANTNTTQLATTAYVQTELANEANWNTAYGWGDHSTQGYLTSVAFADLTAKPTTLSGYGITDAAALAGSASQEFSASTLNATTVDLGDWTVTESAGVLYFATGGVNKMKLDASGNLTVVGDVTAFGTV